MDRMKRFLRSGCVVCWYMQAAAECSDIRVCVLNPCVSMWEQTCFTLQRKHETHPFCSVCFSCFTEQPVSASPLVDREQMTFSSSSFPLTHRCFLPLDVLSRACMAFLPHLFLFPFVPQWGVSWETLVLDLSLSVVRAAGVLGERQFHVGAS